jgi:hypothetical protein
MDIRYQFMLKLMSLILINSYAATHTSAQQQSNIEYKCDNKFSQFELNIYNET